jgi:hypothetical protein
VVILHRATQPPVARKRQWRILSNPCHTVIVGLCYPHFPLVVIPLGCAFSGSRSSNRGCHIARHPLPPVIGCVVRPSWLGASIGTVEKWIVGLTVSWSENWGHAWQSSSETMSQYASLIGTIRKAVVMGKGENPPVPFTMAPLSSSGFLSAS